MARYYFNTRSPTTPTQTNASATIKTFASVEGVTATLCRGRIIGLTVGTDGAPNATDCALVYSVQRHTASGTGVAATTAAQPLVPGDVATRATCKVNHTIEGTITAVSQVWSRTLNQRASMQWTAPDQDAALLWPATNAAGLVVMAVSPTYASTLGIGVDFEDL
jgi:hypothetical protein